MGTFRKTLIVAVACSGGLGQSALIGDANLCDLAAERAARRNGVPIEILRSITRVETGRMVDGQRQPWPWTVNQGGQGYWFDDSDAAIGFAKQQLASGEDNFDLGCFQVNLHWHGAAFDSVDAAMDPRKNADVAARFLAGLHDSEGGWEQAIAAYHSRSPDEAAAYLEKVSAGLPGATQTELLGGPTDATASGRGPNTFPLLQVGLRGVGASLVPETAGSGPLIAMGW